MYFILFGREERIVKKSVLRGVFDKQLLFRMLPQTLSHVKQRTALCILLINSPYCSRRLSGVPSQSASTSALSLSTWPRSRITSNLSQTEP